LGDVRATLFLDDPDEIGLEATVACRISKLQDFVHPVIEALGAAIEENERGIAGHEFEIVGLDPRAADGELLGERRQEHDFAIAGGSKADGDDERNAKPGVDEREEVALAQQRLLTLV
jgi:hypothetical protein